MENLRLTWRPHGTRIVTGAVFGLVAWAFSSWLLFSSGLQINIRRKEMAFLCFIIAAGWELWMEYRTPRRERHCAELTERGYWELNVCGCHCIYIAVNKDKQLQASGPSDEDQIHCLVEDHIQVWACDYCEAATGPHDDYFRYG